MTESELQQQIMIEAPFHYCYLLRNNSGKLPDKNGRWVSYGLGFSGAKVNENFKSSDLIGILVRDGRGIFIAVEIKKPGWKFNPRDKREAAQWNFIEWVKARGGIGGFVSSLEDFRNLIKQ